MPAGNRAYVATCNAIFDKEQSYLKSSRKEIVSMAHDFHFGLVSSTS